MTCAPLFQQIMSMPKLAVTEHSNFLTYECYIRLSAYAVNILSVSYPTTPKFFAQQQFYLRILIFNGLHILSSLLGSVPVHSLHHKSYMISRPVKRSVTHDLFRSSNVHLQASPHLQESPKLSPAVPLREYAPAHITLAPCAVISPTFQQQLQSRYNPPDLTSNV